jgi:hypothetical protein
MKFVLRAIVATAIVLIIAMWVYALFFASKVSVNKFEDRNWAVRAQERCLVAREERKSLSDYRVVDSLGKDALAERADLIDLATDTIEKEFRRALPSDPKGRELVGLWLDDYEIYIADRREFANNLRAGINERFSETPIEGLPISEKIATFAADNEMSYCKPPIDLSI